MPGFPVEVPFLEFVGATLLDSADGVAHTQIDLDRHHLNSFAAAHGGVSMTLLDVTMAMAARSLAHASEGNGVGLVTVEMKATFLQPGTGRLRCEGRCLHRTATLAFCEAGVVDAAGRPIARASGTFKYVRHRKNPP